MKLKMEWTIPNILTTVRLFAIPFLGVFIFYSKDGNKSSGMFSMIAFAFFAAIWITDAADGYIARRFNMTSDFGKIYDPFVDKLFQFTTAFPFSFNSNAREFWRISTNLSVISWLVNASKI